MCLNEGKMVRSNVKSRVATYVIASEYIEGHVDEQKYHMLLDCGASQVSSSKCGEAK